MERINEQVSVGKKDIRFMKDVTETIKKRFLAYLEKRRADGKKVRRTEMKDDPRISGVVEAANNILEEYLKSIGYSEYEIIESSQVHFVEENGFAQYIKMDPKTAEASLGYAYIDKESIVVKVYDSGTNSFGPSSELESKKELTKNVVHELLHLIGFYSF